jgi:hypothetical protein
MLFRSFVKKWRMDTYRESSIYQEFASFLAELDPEKILAFKPSEKQQQRFSQLLEQRRTNELAPEELEELSYFFTLEKIIRLAKAKALTLIVHESVPV